MEELLKEINSDKVVKQFVSNLTKEEIEMNICLLLEQVKANKICNNCLGKKECLSDVTNMQSYLIKNTSFITREYCECEYISQKITNGIEVLYFNDDFSHQDIYINDNRVGIFNAINEYKNSTESKGIYLYGSFGSGKTFLMYNLAKYLAKKNKKVIFAYYPELVRNAKAAIANGTLDKLIVKLKNTDVLMLDDIGGEMNTSFIRDEFLGPILQYRMTSSLPVFMTSNLDIESLQNHLAGTRDEYNPLKASRLMERIVYLMKVVELKDHNYRNN